MKKIKLVLLTSICFLGAFFAKAQEKTTWKEQGQFHDIMSVTFHPSEEGNLAPLKAKSDSLVIIAKQWKAAPIPADYKPKQTAESIAKLLTQCEGISAAVKAKKDDKALTTMIKEAHDTFHYIVGECKEH
jgi:hypothetical protein